MAEASVHLRQSLRRSEGRLHRRDDDEYSWGTGLESNESEPYRFYRKRKNEAE